MRAPASLGIAGPASALLAALVILLTSCRPTVWPSDAAVEDFCAVVSSPAFADGRYDGLVRTGTPESMPAEARRHLLDLAEGDEPTTEGEAAFEEYVASYC